MLRSRLCRNAATLFLALALAALPLVLACPAVARGGPGGPGGGGNPGQGPGGPGYPGAPGGPQFRNNLPPGHSKVMVGPNPYYFHGGHFYRPMRGGFVAVFPPVGLVITTLPPGFQVMAVAGITYYVYEGIYYQTAPGGYVVVSPPATTTVVSAPSGMVAPAQSASGSCVVIAASLNVRSGPGMAYPVLLVVNENDILDLMGRTGTWLFVRLPNGNMGWVDGQFTSQSAAPPASG